MYDVVVWAAVSTLEQAEKASIGHQLKLADEWIAKNGARKVAELVVPGHTREYIFLQEIMRDVPAYAQLVEMVAGTKSMPGKRFNLLLAYDHTRLARGEALLAQIREFLGENGIQIGYTAQFMPLMPPGEFDYKQAFSIKALSAFQGVTTSQEMGTLRARAKFGKESKAEAGHCMAPMTPYGFEKITKGLLGPVEEEISIIKYMHRLYLEEGLGMASVAKRLNAEGIRTRQGNIWYADGVKKAMFHEALLGKVAYGKTRIVKVPSGDGLEMVKRRVRGNLIVRAAHDTVISEERYQHLLDERDRRRHMRRGASVLSPRVYVLSGILVCDYCGGPMYAKGAKLDKNGDIVYMYQCYNHQKAGTCRSNACISRRVEAQAERILRDIAMASDVPSFVDDYLAQHNPGETAGQVEARLKALVDKQKRLQDGYLGGAFNLDAFKNLQAEVADQIRELEAARGTLEAVQGRVARKTALLEWLTGIMEGDEPLETAISRQRLKIIYREMFESINVRAGNIVSWKLRA